MMVDFSLPEKAEPEQSFVDVKDLPSLVESPKQTNSDLVYASLLSGDPLNKYKEGKLELLNKGESSLVTEQTEDWRQEQREVAEEDFYNIISDSSIPIETRREVIKNYLEKGLVLRDLRDKYIIKQASVDTAITEADRMAQDIYGEMSLQRDSIKKAEEEERLINEAGISFTDAIKAAGSVVANIAFSIPAGLAAGFTILKDQDPDKAEAILKDIQSYAYSPTEIGAQKLQEKIAKAIEFIDIPFKYLGDKALDITGSPGAATFVYTGSSMLGYIGGYKLGKAAIKKGTPSVKKLSPLDTAETASKEAAGTLADSAIRDETGEIVAALETDKAAIINDYYLPKLELEDIKVDASELLKQDKILTDLYDETELDPKIAPVTQIKKEREQYVKILTETLKPHLMLSSSVLGTVDKVFGRSGKGYEAVIDSNYKKLEGTAVFGRNAYHGYKTEKGAQAYLEKLQSETSHLPDPGKLSIIQKENEFFINWNFKREYNKWEEISFGAESLSTHLLNKNWDITWFANKLGTSVWPSYMRMDSTIPAGGATTALKEGRVEGAFVEAQRALVTGTKHAKELVGTILKGSEEGKEFKLAEVRAMNPHLTTAQADQMFLEYKSFRRIQDHLYRFADRSYRKKLAKDNIKVLYDKEGTTIGFVSEPIPLPETVKQVWDINSKKAIPIEQIPNGARVVRMKDNIRIDNKQYGYGVLSPEHQLGEIRAGALTKIPGYVARHYKEWFVLDRIPKSMEVDGVSIPKLELQNYKQAVAMGGTKKEIALLKERHTSEDPGSIYEGRAERKNIEDVIIHDSNVYDVYLKESHKRGENLPAFDRDARVEDVLVSQTRTIQGIAKYTAWDDYTEVIKKQWVTAFGKFTKGEFPKEVSDIHPLKDMNPALEAEFLAAQKIYQQWEIQQIGRLPSDVLWKESLHHLADIFEKTDINAGMVREFAEKGVVPLKAAKALGSHLFLFSRPIRMWVVQPQQWKELSIVDPSFTKVVADIMPVVAGLLSKSSTLNPIKPLVDMGGKRVTKEYDELVQALEETGIMQAVNMNQMLHGFWRDALVELDPAAMGKAEKTLTRAKQVVEAPFRAGRRVGYDPAELTNQVSLWLFSKHRWEKNNPGKTWNTPEAKEEITQYAQRVGHMSATRAGMYTWQEGTMSLITQFAAIPFKSMMQMISAKEFTGPEKARLAAARLFWYGKYGIPFGASIYAIMERNIEDPEDKARAFALSEGVTSALWESVLDGMFRASHEREASLGASQSLATVPESIWFYDLGEALVKMARGEKADHKFPFMSAGSNLYTAVRGMYDIVTIPKDAGIETDWQADVWKSVSWIGGLSDYSKYRVAEQITKGGSSYGFQQTGAEAVARLFGVAPKSDLDTWEYIGKEANRTKSIKADAKTIHERLIYFTKDRGLTDQEAADAYWKGFESFKKTSPPDLVEELTDEIIKLDKKRHETLKDSVLLNLYRNSKYKNDAAKQEAEDLLSHSTDPETRELLKDLESSRK